jgi:hypothetical protein
MVAGDVVNTAARLQSARPVNGILAGEQTYRATERAIEYRTAEPVEAKGKSQPVSLAGSGSALAIAVERVARRGAGRPAPRGRSARGRARPGARERSSQLVTIVGVPGSARAGSCSSSTDEIEQPPRADLLAARPVPSLRRGHYVLGTRGDGQGQLGILEGDDAGRRRTEAGRRRSPTVGAVAPAPAGRAGRRRLRAGATCGTSLRRVAPLLRGARRGAAARARLRGSALGR